MQLFFLLFFLKKIFTVAVLVNIRQEAAEGELVHKTAQQAVISVSAIEGLLELSER